MPQTGLYKNSAAKPQCIVGTNQPTNQNKMESSKSLEEAQKNVNLLDDLALSDEQPVIEAPAASITYNPNFDTNFEDSEAFITCNSKYLEEAAMHRGLVSLN